MTGGAWIIGYRAWGTLVGRFLQTLGIIMIAPDYRNYPQGTVTEMLEDVDAAMQWVFTNISVYGGDPNNIVLVGQSAGAQLSVVSILHQAIYGRPYPPKSNTMMWSGRLKAFVGVSGPYDLAMQAEYMDVRGLSKDVFSRIMEHRLGYFSPSTMLKQLEASQKSSFLPAMPRTMHFLHGDCDKTVPVSISVAFSQALAELGVPVQLTLFSGKSHTDPILEDPMTGMALGWLKPACFCLCAHCCPCTACFYIFPMQFGF
jgi:prenylcysteine alpha-carboxyl methylesterase